MIRPFLPWPDRRLRSPAAPVEAVTETIRALWDDMVETMEAMPGYGLAAPQIGVMLRLAVVDASKERGQAMLLANPELLHASVEFAQPRGGQPQPARRFGRGRSGRGR